MQGPGEDQRLDVRRSARPGCWSSSAWLGVWSGSARLGGWSGTARLGRWGGSWRGRLGPYWRAWLASLLLLFSLSTFAALRIGPEFIARIKQEQGAAVAARIEGWQRLMDFARDFEDEQEKLKIVNEFFNKLKFVDDQRLWRVEDYWATPLEFLAKNGGDCEDFAIAKYFTLLALGIPEERLRLTYVKALDINQSHMVLTYYATPRDSPLVLDNLNPQILPATERPDLQPVYSFNGSGLWLAKSIGTGKQIDKGDRLDTWQDLLSRMPAMADEPAAGDVSDGE